MADEKKPGKPGDKKGGDTTHTRLLLELVGIVAAVLLLGLFLRYGSISGFFDALSQGKVPGFPAISFGQGNFGVTVTNVGPDGQLLTTSNAFTDFTTRASYFIQGAILNFVIFSNVLSVFLLMGVIYSYIRLRELNVAEFKRVNDPSVFKGALAPEQEGNKQWNEVVTRINEDNPSDWRLAIIEADVILDELLDKIGCVGSTIGDKLKQVNKGDFQTLDSAWEAHKIRNKVAHQGSEFMLTSRDAKRAIMLYEQVFKEFHYI